MSGILIEKQGGGRIMLVMPLSDENVRLSAQRERFNTKLTAFIWGILHKHQAHRHKRQEISWAKDDDNPNRVIRRRKHRHCIRSVVRWVLVLIPVMVVVLGIVFMGTHDARPALQFGIAACMGILLWELLLVRYMNIWEV